MVYFNYTQCTCCSKKLATARLCVTFVKFVPCVVNKDVHCFDVLYTCLFRLCGATLCFDVSCSCIFRLCGATLICKIVFCDIIVENIDFSSMLYSGTPLKEHP